MDTPQELEEQVRSQGTAPEHNLSEEQIARLLRVRIATRRHIPLSCTSSWKKLVSHITTDAQLRDSLPLVLPKLILHASKEHQNPRQREQQVVHNLQLAQAQAWQTLYSRSMMQVLPITQGHQDITQMDGDTHLTMAEAKKIMKLAREGQQSKAWKMLHNPGLAATTPESFKAATDKLRPRKDAPITCDQPAASWDIPAAHWQQAIKHLHHKRSADPGGWSTELWQGVWQDSGLQPTLQKWIADITSPTASQVTQRLLAITHLVMLAKPAGNGVRPILLINFFKKIHHSAVSRVAGSELHRLTDAHQFGHQSQGTLLLLAAAEGHRMMHPQDILVQLDISNAFGNLNRKKVIEILHKHATPHAKETWLPLIQHSLSAGTEIVSPHDSDITITSHDGIPQGDPLSTLLFSSVMALILAEWAAFAAAAPASTILAQGPHNIRDAPFVVSYVDDNIIAMKVEELPARLLSLQEHLSEYGLQLQTEKTRIWGSSIVRADPQTTAKMCEANIPLSALRNGLTVCGNALGDEADTELPLGDDHYVAQWLTDKAAEVGKKLQRLSSLVLVDANELPLVQAALLILRTTWPGAITHILRALPVSLSRQWAETIQPLFDDCFATITNTTHLDGHQQRLRSLPLNKGGLGLPNLGELALAARLASLASISEHARAHHYKTSCINQEARELALRIEDVTGAPTQPIIGTVQQLPEGQSHKGLQQKLSNLFHLAHAKALRLALNDSHPLMQAWKFHTTTELPGAPPLHPGQASWLLAPPLPHLCLTNLDMQLGIRRRLGLPLLKPQCRCARLLAGHKPCDTIMDTAGYHALNCCQTIRTHRHNAIRDHICKYGKQAGLLGQIEQIVPQSEASATHNNAPPQHEQRVPLEPTDLDPLSRESQAGSAHQAEEAPSANMPRLRRADIQLSSTTCPDIWLDVRVTHCPVANTMNAHLAQQESLKRQAYKQSNLVPVGVFAGLRPFIIDTRGRAAFAAREFAAWIIQRRVRELQKTRAFAYSAAISIATNEFWQPIAVILQRSWTRALGYQPHALIISKG